ncbi:hypothetical protein [Actinoplanes sp. GCM10030250]|uniref:hypothetical protein n=1 Tax=Actinoplanes sp. GCM10030250 TaxID=3273376 RepID=UPI00361C29E5
MRKFTKRSAALITAGVVAVGGAGAAYAAWLLSGTGTASASASEVQQLQVSAISVTPAFFPGSTNNLVFTVTNPNPFPVEVTSITVPGIASTVEDSECADNNVTYDPAPAAAVDVPNLGPAGSGTAAQTVTLTGALGMIDDAQDGCQGVAFDYSVTVSGQSAAS